MEQITNSYENKKNTIGTFIDLSKAFATIDHNLLFQKLEFYGIRGTPLYWIKSYLCKREQFVQIDDIIDELTILLNRELELFVKWFALNKLSLNVKNQILLYLVTKIFLVI